MLKQSKTVETIPELDFTFLDIGNLAEAKPAAHSSVTRTPVSVGTITWGFHLKRASVWSINHFTSAFWHIGNFRNKETNNIPTS